jgi:hypothetical protein
MKDDATMLGKEAMEIVYNLRDSNLDKWLLWYCGEFNNAALSKCNFDLWQNGTWTNYIVDREVDDGTSDTMYTLSTYASDEDTRLYFHTWNFNLGTGAGENRDISRYNHDPTGTVTPYSRYVTIRPVDDYSANADKILQVEVHVTADQWVRQLEIILESLIWDIR